MDNNIDLINEILHDRLLAIINLFIENGYKTDIDSQITAIETLNKNLINVPLFISIIGSLKELRGIKRNSFKNSGSHIAVISLGIEDFQRWKLRNILNYGGLNKLKKFRVGNDVYYCITKAHDLCSLSINKIMETENAKENKEYDKIKNLILLNKIQ